MPISLWILSSFLILQAQQPEVLNVRGTQLYQAGHYIEAEALFKRAVEIWEQQPGSGGVDLASGLSKLATTYAKLGPL
jgi:Flp pilus assembly protein TadD